MITVIASAGIVGATIYSLWIVQRALHGPNDQEWKIPDFSARETAIMLVMMLSLIWLGIYPQPVFDTSQQAISNLNMIGTPGKSAGNGGQGQQGDMGVPKDAVAKPASAVVSALALHIRRGEKAGSLPFQTLKKAGRDCRIKSGNDSIGFLTNDLGSKLPGGQDERG